MGKIENINLGKLTTFGIHALADEFWEIQNRHELNMALDYIVGKSKNYFILGGGSNTIFLKDFNGIVLQIRTKGISILNNSNDDVLIEVESGEIWDDFVKWTVEKNFYGLENLAAIPGTVGASPIQNIGAYGSEVKDTIESVEYIEILSGKIFRINNIDCKFGYRNSIFKEELKNKVVILSVRFRLSKNKLLKMDYFDVKEELKEYNLNDINSLSIYNAISTIRGRKLPDPKIVGNSGSFFKNPVITKELFNHLINKFPDLKYFYQNESEYKLAAGWMIEKSGWKGKSHGGCKVHENQALVITNAGNAKALDLLEIIEMIKQDVYRNFSVNIEPEVNLVKK